MSKKFFSRLVKIEPNTRKPFRVGRARVWVDREADGSFTVQLPARLPVKFTLALDAAYFLRDCANGDAAQERHDNRFN